MSDVQNASAQPVQSNVPEMARESGPYQDRRVQRIEDYLSSALDEDNPLLANLGAVNCDLLEIELFLRQAVTDALAHVQPNLSHLEHLAPGIDQLLKLAKQIDRFTQLELKVRSEEQNEKGDDARLAVLGG